VENTGDLMMSAARSLRREYAAATVAWGMTPGKARALRMIAAEGPVRLSVLADLLGIVPRSATEVVDALEALGYVAREADPVDRRATCVAATEDGRRVLAEIEVARVATSERFFAGLPAADRAALERILVALAGVRA
jgi:DNA-binding MarR family transcriptional regulator